VADHKEIGAQLKQKRAESGKKMADISEEIKVSVEYLTAIEEGRVNDLPSAVYYKLFVKAYAQEVGLDAEKLLEEPEFTLPIEQNNINEEIIKDQPEQKEKGKPTEISVFKIGIVIGGLVIVGFIIILFLSLGDDNNEPVLSGHETTSDETMDLPDINILNESDSTQIEELVAATEPEQNYPINQPMELQVFIRQTSWVLVIADGDTVLNRNLEPDSRRTLRADYRFAISMGNPFGVDLSINDSLLKPLSETGRPIKNLEINQLNKSEFYSRPEEVVNEEP